jgi:hypothetical protein
MATELREGVSRGAIGFSSGSDADVVISLYKQAFVRAFNDYRQCCRGGIHYNDLGWGTKQVPSLVAALEYAEVYCRPKDEAGEQDTTLTLYLDGNAFTNREEKARLRRVIPESSPKFNVQL